MQTTLTPEHCEAACLRPGDVIPHLDRFASAERAVAAADRFALLADPTRVRILAALAAAGELCVCDLSVVVGVSESAVSHQLRGLRAAGAVRRRREGRLVRYSLAEPSLVELLDLALGR